MVWRDDFSIIRMICHVCGSESLFFVEYGECEWLGLSMSRSGAVYVGHLLGNASRFFEDLQLAEGFREREREHCRKLRI